MQQDKAGKAYWNEIWDTKNTINEIDINYYTYTLFHSLYMKYFQPDNSKKILEIGCALSANLLYFNKYFGYKINGFDYDKDAVDKTKLIYDKMGYKANIFFRDFFSTEKVEKFDIVSSFGVFEHFENLEKSIDHTKFYLKDNGMILTVIPNMNGLVGLLQKTLNRTVYDVHIPYTKEELQNAHETVGYHTLYCNYFGLYQAGVVNLEGNKFAILFQKILAIPGKLIYRIHNLTKIPFDSKYISPYIVYIGVLKP